MTEAMTEAKDTSYRFEELRAILQQAPSEDVWRALCALCANASWSERAEEWCPYAEAYLDRYWPDKLRVSRYDWWSAPATRHMIKLARVADFNCAVTPDMLNALEPATPQLTHLSIRPFAGMDKVFDFWIPHLSTNITKIHFVIPWDMDGRVNLNNIINQFTIFIEKLSNHKPKCISFSDYYHTCPEKEEQDQLVKIFTDHFKDHAEEFGILTVTPENVRMMAGVEWLKLKELHLIVYDPTHPQSFEHPQTLAHGAPGSHRILSHEERHLLRRATHATILPQTMNEHWVNLRRLEEFP